MVPTNSFVAELLAQIKAERDDLADTYETLLGQRDVLLEQLTTTAGALGATQRAILERSDAVVALDGGDYEVEVTSEDALRKAISDRLDAIEGEVLDLSRPGHTFSSGSGKIDGDVLVDEDEDEDQFPFPILNGEGVEEQANFGLSRHDPRSQAGTSVSTKLVSRAGVTPDQMLDSVRALFGAKGFTVNDYVRQAHWEDTKNKKEAARQLFQQLVKDGQLGRVSRCDPGYVTEVEYHVLDVGGDSSPGVALALLRDDVRDVVQPAVRAGWKPARKGSSFVQFVSPCGKKHFNCLTDPQSAKWKENLQKSMRNYGAPLN